MGTKHWQRNYRRPRICLRQINQNLPSKIHATVKFMEGGQYFDSIESRNNLLIFQEHMPRARSICRTKCQSTWGGILCHVFEPKFCPYLERKAIMVKT